MWFGNVYWEMKLFGHDFLWDRFWGTVEIYALCQFVWMINDSLRGKHE